MKNILQKTGSLALSVILVCALLPVRTAANFEIPRTCLVRTDTGASETVKTLDYDYDYNTYFSLRDMAMALRDTDKAFSLEVTKNAVSLNPGESYQPAGGENVPWEDSENPDVTLRRNEFKVSGETVYYYTLIMRLPSGCYDCFMTAVDLAMLLDVDIAVPAAGCLQVNTGEPFRVSLAELEQAGYFCGVNGVLVGDATTGEIYYRYQSDIAYPIASTTKLMTCLLAMDALAQGRISLEERGTVSEAAHLLSASDDGVISLDTGDQITVRDLMLCALLPSSNECALCLAETVAGTEEAFVEMMNRKALELGLTQAVFYNSHGLPFYTEAPVPSKRQNRMSAEDMFRLASYFLKVYPQITNITSLKSAELESLDLEVRNSNPLLHNLPEATGLKTGTTNKAGACLVTSLTADDGETEHDLVVVVLGAEDSMERGRVSGVLARYALQAFSEGTGENGEGQASRNPGGLPTDAETAVNRILRTAVKR